MLTTSAVKKYIFYIAHLSLILFIAAIYTINRLPVKTPSSSSVLGLNTESLSNNFYSNESTAVVTDPVTNTSVTQEEYFPSTLHIDSTSFESGSDANQTALPNTDSYNFEFSLIGLGLVLIFNGILIFCLKKNFKITLKKPQIQTYLFNTTKTSCQTF